jgi:hypothetical protein
MIWHTRSIDPCFTLEYGSARTFQNDAVVGMMWFIMLVAIIRTIESKVSLPEKKGR